MSSRLEVGDKIAVECTAAADFDSVVAVDGGCDDGVVALVVVVLVAEDYHYCHAESLETVRSFGDG